MNLFFLSADPRRSARDYSNQHVNKILLEVLQMLEMPSIEVVEWGEGTQAQYDAVADSLLRMEFETSLVKMIKGHINGHT